MSALNTSIPRQATFLAALVAACGAILTAADARSAETLPTGDIHVVGACTAAEKWEYGSHLTAYWNEKFKVPFKKDETGLQTFLLAGALRDSTKKPDIKALADYWTSRSLLQLNLPRVAEQHFVALFMADPRPETASIRTAALVCISHILAAHPSLELPEGFLAHAVATHAPPRVIWSIAFREELQNTRGGLHSLTQSNESPTSYIQGSGFYEALVKTYTAAAHDNDAEVEHWASEFLTARVLPEELIRYHDPVAVMLGRSQLNQKKYDASIASFKRVRNTSNSFAHAVNGMSWAYLHKGEMANAVGEAQNTVVGGLRSVFDPEANLVISIALNEICNFPETMDSIRYFKRSYGSTYRWLMTYDKAPAPGAPPAPSLYEQLVQGLKKKNSTPERVLTEWVRSPVFLAAQDELNLLLDEKVAQKELPGKLALVSSEKKSKKWKQTQTELIALLQSAGTTIASRQSQLVASINRDLNFRTRRMKVSLYEVLSNLRLVEAEVYNSMSKKMVVDFANPGLADAHKAKERATIANKNPRSAAVWDWGRFPSGDDDGKAEIWEDELGFLKTDLISKCDLPE